MADKSDTRTVNMVHYPNKDASDARALDEYLDAIPVEAIDATGTPDSTNFLRGDGSWQVPSAGGGGGGDVFKVGTPVDSQVGVWTGDGTIEGTSGLTYDGSALSVTGNITVSGTVDGVDIANHTHAASDITSGTFADARIAESNVTQHESAIDHDALTNFVANEHIDWTAATANFATSGTGTFEDVVSIQISAANVADEVYDATTGLRIETELPNVGTATANSANQFGMMIQTSMPVTSSTVSYEKCAALFVSATSDPSTYSPQVTRDCVGLDMRGYIKNDNSSGRAYGGYSEARILTGGTGDGYLVAHECYVINEGVEQASISQQDGKYSLTLVSAGSNPATAAMYVVGDGNTYRNGIVFDSAVIENATDPALWITDDAFKLTRDGVLSLGDGNNNFSLEAGTTPQWVVDANDALQYDRTANAFVVRIGGSSVGVLSGAAIRPATDGGLALGSGSEAFSDLYLTGDITVGGTVDGRDVAADGSKLDTIESNADVTDAANVAAAGALMSSWTTHGSSGAVGAVATVTYGSIPASATEIKIHFIDISHNSGSTRIPTLLLGDSGGIESSGYISKVSSPAATTLETTRFNLDVGGQAAAGGWNGVVTLRLVAGNTWELFGWSGYDAAALGTVAGVKTTSAALTQIQMGWSDTGSFDAGTINVYYR